MKQIIVVRNDLKLPKGKMCAQVAHASVENVLKMLKERKHRTIAAWHDEGMKKVVAKVNSLKELGKIKTLAKNQGLTVCMIRDAGMTVVKPGTITCIGIGPADEEEIDAITKDLKLM